MKTGLVFPGQGAQFVGMGKSLLERYAEARDVFTEADDRLGFSLTKLCLEGPEDELRLTYYTQPAILTMSIAAFQVLSGRVDVSPMVAAGHSLGEYSALVATGAMAFSDAVALVYERGKLMDEAVPAGLGTMAAVLGMEEDALEAVCRQASTETGEVVELANLNCPGQIVISGTIAAVAKAGELAKSNGAKRAIPLPVSGPFHCSLMRSAAQAFSELLQGIDIQQADIAVVANVDGRPHQDPQEIRDALQQQLYLPVRWVDDVKTMRTLGVETLVELGPGTVLSGLIRKIDKGIATAHVEDDSTLEQAVALFTA